jgi:hypothetical protein
MKTAAIILFVLSGLFLVVALKEAILSPVPKDIIDPPEVFGYQVGLFVPSLVIFFIGLFLHAKANKKAEMLKNENQNEDEDEVDYVEPDEGEKKNN